MLFDFLKDILYKKQGNLLQNVDNESDFSPYLLQRWLSFYSASNIKLINTTTNRYYKTFDTKSDWYKMFLALIPKSPFRKINYIKKVKEKKERSVNIKSIEYLAKNNQMSKREIEYYIDEFGLDVIKLNKALNIKEK